MKFALTLFSLFAASLASDVIVGTNDNFKDLISTGIVLAEFYAPWCGHCKSLAPHWEKAATALKGKASLIKVDATEEKELGGKYAVRGYPTIKAFLDGGDAIEYDGGRTADDIVSWVTKMSGPAVNEVADRAAIDTLLAERGVIVTAFYESESEAEAFTALAKQNRKDYTWAVTYNKDLAKEEGVTAPSVVVYKTFDNKKDIIPEYAADKILPFVKEVSVKIFGEIGPDNYQAYLDRGLPLGWVFVDPSKEEELAQLDTVFSELGAQDTLKGKLSLVYLSGVQYGSMGESLGLSGKSWPSFVIDNSGEHFVFDETKELTKDNLEPWLKSWSEGKLEKTVKSAPAPENPVDENGVTTLVGTTFDEIVNQKGKDVLVKFYAPWCGHCKSMVPDYEKLGKTYAKNDNIIIAKIDATANDSPKEFDVKGFPTLYFVNKENEISKYESGRNFEALQTFIEEKTA